jgi:hypothetical protein
MLQRLKELIEGNGDIEFKLNDRMYTILPWTDDGIVIGPQYSDEESIFQTADELFDGYMIDGIPLRELADKITITFCCS